MVTISRAAPGQLEFLLPEDVDLSDPRILQAATYGIIPEPGASAAAVLGVAAKTPNTVVLSHGTTDLGAAYRLAVGPLASVFGGDRPPEEVPFYGSGVAATVAATPEKTDGLRLHLDPASAGALLSTKTVQVRPVYAYPISPAAEKVQLDPGGSVLVVASGWTELPYDVAAGAARERLLWEAQAFGDADLSGYIARLGAGARAQLQEMLPGTSPVLDVVAAPAGDAPASLSLHLAAGGRRLGLSATSVPGGWEVRAEGGVPVSVAGPLVVRLAIVSLTGKFAVLAQGAVIAGGPATQLAADPRDGAAVSCGAGAAVVAAWLSEVALADPAGNPLFARAPFVLGPPGRVSRTVAALKRPLVASLGPHVPAGPEDVKLTVGGVQVEVSEVDPYSGIVTPRVPIPRGARDVKLEYETTPHLVFPLLASERGMWACEVTTPTGPDSGNYPFSAVLYPGQRPRPPRFAHRYLAARRPTSSLIGDPVGLRIGRDPHTGQPPPLVRPRPPVAIEVRDAAAAGAPPWFTIGKGTLSPGSGASGFQTSPAGELFFIAQDADLRDISLAYATARLDAGPIADGPLQVGPAIGFHDESHLYLLAVLDSLGSRYVGVLLNPENPGDLASWSVWPRTPISAENRGIVTADPALLPRLLAVGDLMRIPGGPQAGSYKVASLRKAWPSGRVEIGIEPQLPADPREFGARDAAAWFDLGPGTLVLRIEADLQTGSALVSSVGARAVLALDDAGKPAPGRMLQVQEFGEAPGRFLVGHPAPGGPAEWGAVAGAAIPIEDPARIQKREVRGPQSLPSFDWAQVGEVRAAPAEVMAASGASESGILRPDRALGPDALSSLEVTARAMYGAGTLGIQAEMSNGERRALLASVAYDEVSGRTPFRQVAFYPSVYAGVGGAQAPPWSTSGGSWSSTGVLTSPPGQAAQWSATVVGEGGRLLDLDASPPAAGTLSIAIEAGAGSQMSAVLEFSAGQLRVLSAAGAEVARRALAGQRVRALAALLPPIGALLMIEGDAPLSVPAAQIGDPGAAGLLRVLLAAPRRAAQAGVTRLAAVALPAAGTKFTFGILRDPENPGDINAWELPREDATTAKNSEEAGPVIREMDPRADSALRLVIDPEWGAVFLRPDMPPPPYYDPARARFAGDMTEPSAGWVNVSYDELPLVPGGSSYLWVGAGEGSRARFSDIRATIEARSAPGEIGFVPRAEIGRDDEANSGDHAQTAYPAVARVRPASDRQVSIKETGLWMRSILEVIDGDRVITPPDADLDQDGQVVTLASGVQGFSGEVVEVRGNPALPINEEYLRQLPVRGSPNEVGEGTPPIFPRYFSKPEPVVKPDPGSTGRAIEFPMPPPTSPLLARSVFTVSDPGQKDLISFPSDDPSGEGTRATGPGGEPIPVPPGPPPPSGGPVIEVGGGLFWDRFPLFDDGTERNFVRLDGPFRPAGGKHKGTPTIDVPPYRPAAVLLPARGPFRRGNPRIVLTGPGGAPIPTAMDSFALVRPGTVVIEIDDGMTVKTYNLSE